MAYSDDAVKAKLSALNETQDSIVTVAQWIMFHRRHADRTASLWLSRLQDTSNTAKRLNLIYLANEVVQQSRARSKQDFLLAFEPLIADATTHAYKGASQEVQGKLRRVVEVWGQRQIFDPRIQEQTEKRLEEIDKQKGGKGFGESGRRLGGSLFGGSGGIATELDASNKHQTAVNKAEAGAQSRVTTASAEYAKAIDPNTPIPSAPVRCAKLRGLVKDLMAAQHAVEISIKARSELLASLETLVETHRGKLAEDSDTASQLTMQINTIEIKAREVEDSIMRGQSETTATDAVSGGTNGTSEPARPETEGFTPPPPEIESFTPPPEDVSLAGGPAPLIGDGTPLEHAYANPTGADAIQELPPSRNEPRPTFQPPPVNQREQAAAQAQDFLQSFLAASQVRQASGEVPASAATGAAGDPRLKRRKMSHKTNDIDEDIFGAGNVGGVDEDGISAMLGQ